MASSHRQCRCPPRRHYYPLAWENLKTWRDDLRPDCRTDGVPETFSILDHLGENSQPDYAHYTHAKPSFSKIPLSSLQGNSQGSRRKYSDQCEFLSSREVQLPYWSHWEHKYEKIENDIQTGAQDSKHSRVHNASSFDETIIELLLRLAEEQNQEEPSYSDHQAIGDYCPGGM